MGEYKEISKMRWLPLTLYGVSFLRVVLKKYDIGSDSGFILVADDEQQARVFGDAYCRGTDGNGHLLTLKNYKKVKLDNYCLGLANLKGSQSDIDDFLAVKDFFPVIISGGILPSELRDGYYIFRLHKADEQYVVSEQFKKDITLLKKFILENIDILCYNFSMIDTSLTMKQYISEVEQKSLFKMMTAICCVMKTLRRSVFGEKDACSFENMYIKRTLLSLELICEFADGLDLAERLTEAILDYIDADKLLTVQLVNDTNSEVLTQMENDQALLYDDEYYYVMENTMRCICYPLLITFSWVELKHKLAEAGLILKVESGFTHKISVKYDNETTRIRVMKLRKNFLTNSSEISLKEYLMNKKDDKKEGVEE